MASTFTDILRLELPTTGELDATWGTRVNVGITALVETALAGTAAVTHSDAADYTLTTASGAADEARAMFLNIGGALGAARNVVCPTKSKLYFVRNSTTGGFAFTLKTAAGTGISVPNGKYMVLYCDGTNVVSAVNYIPGLVIGTDVQAYDAGLTTWAGVTPGADVATFLATPTIANLNTAISDADVATVGKAIAMALVFGG